MLSSLFLVKLGLTKQQLFHKLKNFNTWLELRSIFFSYKILSLISRTIVQRKNRTWDSKMSKCLFAPQCVQLLQSSITELLLSVL